MHASKKNPVFAGGFRKDRPVILRPSRQNHASGTWLAVIFAFPGICHFMGRDGCSLRLAIYFMIS
jgi:hypothetical protein